MKRPPITSGEIDRGHVAALRVVAQFQRAVQRRDRPDIVASVQELVALRAPMAGQWLDLASIATDCGEFNLAREAADLYVEAFGGTPAVLSKKVDVLAYMGQFGEALALLRTLPPIVPDALSYALSRGALTVSTGDAAEARQWLLEALRLNPRTGLAWHLISLIVDFASEPELTDKLLANERAMQSAPQADRAYYYHALGKAYASLREHGRAFAAVARAGQETKAVYPYDRALDRRTALEAVKGYTPERMAALARQQSEQTDRSIFVMGLPRSGTTLVEHILTNHSEVSDGGEINLLRLLVHDVGDASYPALANYVEKAGAPSLARFWKRLVDERFPASDRVVDKTTDTSRKLGLAAAVLPDAPLIWLTREPLDCAWSCFRNCFMQNVRWSNDLQDIAFDFRLERELLVQWQRILGERLLVVPLEELAGEPERWIGRIIAHCGLTPEPQVFEPHDNNRMVMTASAMQVRRPISRAEMGTADPYRQYLGPFVDAYNA